MYAFEVRQLTKSLILWSTLVGLVLVLFMAFFPSMANSDMAELARAKFNAIPPAMREVLGISGMTDFADLLQYFAYMAGYIMIAACIYAAALGTSALMRDESEGTIEFLYAQPVSRFKITAAKLMAVFSVLLVFNAFLFVVTIVLFEAFKPPGYQYLTMLWHLFLAMFGSQLVFLALGYALSTLLPRSVQPATAALGLFFTTYLLGDVAVINKQVQGLKYLSPYHYAQPSAVLQRGGTMQNIYIYLILLITCITIVLAIWRYQRKDLMV
ncbi:MAG: ABC transporter permease subunit [Candidatus Saccharibacteria bacterium]